MTKVVVGGGMSGEMASPDDEAVEGLESTQGEILQCSDICQYSTIVMQYDMIDCMYSMCAGCSSWCLGESVPLFSTWLGVRLGRPGLRVPPSSSSPPRPRAAVEDGQDQQEDDDHDGKDYEHDQRRLTKLYQELNILSTYVRNSCNCKRSMVFQNLRCLASLYPR